MKYNIFFIFMLFLLFGCAKRINNPEDILMHRFETETLDISKNELPAKLLPNIDSVCDFINENIKDNKINYNEVFKKLNSNFLESEYNIGLGYNWYNGIVIADINMDGVYELFINGNIGSGIIHSFIHCYDPVEEKYYIISKRYEMDYIAFVFENNIYIYGNRGMFSSNENNEIRLYRPLFINNEMVLDELEINLYNKIIDEFDFENIYRQISQR